MPSLLHGLRALALDWRSRARARARRMRLPPPGEELDRIRADSQSLGFAVDLCRILQEEIPSTRPIRLTLLDVGARTGSGSNLVAQVFHPDAYTHLKLDVTALDIDPAHADEARALYPDVEYRVADILSVTDRYDVVTCSHTLEHLADPGPVLDHLRSIARRLVIVAAPFGEVLDESIPNPSRHLSSFDEAFFRTHAPDRLEVFRSPHWSASPCFVAVYGPRGRARG